MKVAFIIPGKKSRKWLIREETRTREEYYAYPPYQAAVFLGIIKKALPGAEVKVFDCQLKNWDSSCLKKEIRSFEPDLAVCQLSAFYLPHDMQFCDLPGTTTIVSISPSSISCREAKDIYPLAADVYLKKEREWSLYNALCEFNARGRISETTGLLVRDDSGHLKDTGDVPKKNLSLDDLPFPDFEGIRYGRYVDLREKALGIRYGIIETSHGCLFNCRYCSQARRHKQPVFKSAETVNKEIHYLKAKYNIEFLEFQDAEFGFDKQRSKNICRFLIEGKYHLKWIVNNRVELVDIETLLLMKKAGCQEISYGIESASKEILRKLGKNIDLQKAIKAINLTKKAGIKVNLFFMMGIPGETRETLMKSVEFIGQAKPHSFGFAPYIPMPNTPMYHDLKCSNKLTEHDWSRYLEPFKNINLPMIYKHERYPTKKDLLSAHEWVRRQALRRLAFYDDSRSPIERVILILAFMLYRRKITKNMPRALHKALFIFKKFA